MDYNNFQMGVGKENQETIVSLSTFFSIIKGSMTDWNNASTGDF